jgi:hypothetical protein
MGILPGRLCGRAVRNYGICPICLRERLAALETSRESERAAQKTKAPSPRVAA